MVQGKVEISGVNTAKLLRLKEEEMDDLGALKKAIWRLGKRSLVEI